MLSGREEITGQWRETTLGRKKVKTSEGKKTHLIFQKKKKMAYQPETERLSLEKKLGHEEITVGDKEIPKHLT